MSYIGTEPKDIRSFGRTKFDYTATQGQTAFTGADDDGKILNFTVGQIEVYVNGILMDDSDFSTTGTGTVTLATAANLNDVVNVVSFETNIPDSNYVPATGGTFSGDIDFGANKITYANVYAQLSDLPSASTYHGMFAHVHATGKAYFAHAGAWVPLTSGLGINDNATSTALTLDALGNVGIGTASIASGGTGTVNLNVHTPSATSSFLKMSNSSTGNTASDGFDLAIDSSGNSYLLNRENADMLFYTNASERLRINNAGGVGINGAAGTGNALKITGNSGYDDVMQLTAVGTNIGARINLTNTGTGVARINSTNNSLALQTGGTQRLTINDVGHISVPNIADVVISNKGCLRAGNADHIFGNASGSGVTSTSFLGVGHYYANSFASGQYVHLKTNHEIGTTSGKFSMILVEYIGYQYNPANTIHSLAGMHPYGGAVYNVSSKDNGSFTGLHANEYKSSDGHLVLVINAKTTSSATYIGVTLNFYQTHTSYDQMNNTKHNQDGAFKITGATQSSSVSGVY